MKKKVRQLTAEDFKDVEIGPHLSPLEILIRVTLASKRIFDEVDRMMKEDELVMKREEPCNKSLDISKGERLMNEKSLKKPVMNSLDMSKEERLKREKELKKPAIEQNPKKGHRRIVISPPPKPRRSDSEDSEEDEVRARTRARATKKSERSLKKPDLTKEERLKREKILKRPITEEKPKKSYKRHDESEDSDNEEKSRAIKKKKKKMGSKVLDNGPCPPPDLPPEFKRKIEDMNGSKLMLLIQKRVTATDVCKGQNRLSMPLRRVDADFLSEEEKKLLDEHIGKNVLGISAKLIQPKSCEECNVTFKKWDLKKKKGSSSSSLYVFSKQWNEIKKNNGLEEGMLVQVWSFRTPDNQLWFALVEVEEDGNGNTSSASSQSDHQQD